MQTDVLGAPYEQRAIDLGEDAEGPVTATLVRRRADAAQGEAVRTDTDRAGTATTTAVLYVHGWADYFFQTHLADFFVARGLDFYALDLRKYGRSLAKHQTPNHCTDIQEYYPELDEAVRIIREEDGHDRLLVNGHSTGGLITALWAHDRRDTALVDAMFLNSPFLDLNVPWVLRRPGAAVTARLGRVRPGAQIMSGANSVYGRSIHHEHDGAWQFDLAWKPLTGFPVRAGWVRAIRTGQRRIHHGLDIRVPVLVAASTVSYKRARWGDAARSADSVLDVDHIARWTPALGRAVTLVRIEGGLHDLTLSAEPVRKQLFEEVERWMSVYFPVGSESPGSESPVGPGSWTARERPGQRAERLPR